MRQALYKIQNLNSSQNQLASVKLTCFPTSSQDNLPVRRKAAILNCFFKRRTLSTHPLKGTDYQDEPPPDTEAMLPVFAALYECSMKHGLPIGLAPNVHVSLVMLPWECRWLVPRRVRRRYALKEARLALMRRVFSRRLYRRLRRHDAGRRCGIEPTTNEGESPWTSR